MFGQLAVSKTNVLPAFYTLFLQAGCKLSSSFLQALRKPSPCKVLLDKGRNATPVF
jgi:hypothetical protein